MRSEHRSRPTRNDRPSRALLGAGAIVAVAAAGAISAGLSADIVEFLITMDGTQENPPVPTKATGTGTATLDTDTNEFSWNVEFEGLSSPQTAAHFHGPAPYCTNAGVQIGVNNGSPIVGKAILTDQQEADVLGGRWYLNVHSQNFPAGEIRGQVDPAPIGEPYPDPIPLGDTIRLEMITTGLTAPNWGTFATNSPNAVNHLYVVDQVGLVWAVNTDTSERFVFLDVSDRLVELGIGGPGSFDERGLLGMAFHPDYLSNGLLYTYTSEPFDLNNPPPDFSTMPEGVEPDHQTIITEWEVVNPADPNTVVDPGSARILMRIDEPQFNHNAGCLAFGPDGFLYITLGDGGARDDQSDGHGCNGNGQNIESILGKLLRIDPLGDNSANGEYGIPGDNPFVNADGLDEIYAYGFRNPFRFSFDLLTGELYLGDVGQGHIEELDIVERGGNYGWNVKEGTFRFVRNGDSRGYAASPEHLNRPDLIDPIAEYDHSEGVSIIGGFVYHGSSIPSFEGRYIFGEYQPFSDQQTGRLFYLDENNEIKEFQIIAGNDVVRFLHGFGHGADGEIYALANETGIPFENTGVVLRIAPVFNLRLSGPCPGSMGVAIEGATPGGRVAFVAARGEGSFSIPGGRPCAGTTLGLDDSARLVATRTADENGVAFFAANVPAGACGNWFVQAVDLTSCATSDVEAL